MLYAGGHDVLASSFAFARLPLMIHLMVAGMITLANVCYFWGSVQRRFSPWVAIKRNRPDGRVGIVVDGHRQSRLGTGFESFWLGPRLDKIWSVYRWRPTQAHNGYLEIYLNLGWIGIMLLAVVIFTGYGTISSALRNRRPTSQRRWATY